MFIDFRERGRKGGREREAGRQRNIDGREKHQSVPSHTRPDHIQLVATVLDSTALKIKQLMT